MIRSQSDELQRQMLQRQRYHGLTSRARVVDQALCVFPPPEDLSHQFSQTDLDRAIERKFLSFVANACDDDTNYRRLARNVELEQGLSRRLQDDYGRHVREYVYQLLVSWRQRHPEAKVRDLVTLLSESKLPHSAEQLNNYFSTIAWRD
ncbi:hypothetical protein ACOMHN_035326 [Nucella lapillus]